MRSQRPFHIEGTWLRSRLARRIFLMFCAVALVPATLVFVLTWRQAQGVVDASQQRSLRAETRFVAFTLLSRLQSADALLARIADAGGVTPGDTRVFDAVVRKALPGPVEVAAIPRVRIVGPADGGIAHVVLLAPRTHAGTTVVHAGVLSPRFLWRKEEDVVEGTRVCARASGHGIGCAGSVQAGVRYQHESWELDLAPEFGAAPWRFDAEREATSTLGAQLRGFAPLAAGVLVLALLMSLVQIRRTLVPLEALMARIRTFAGAGAPASPQPPPDELAALGATFDDMQQRIGGQMQRLRSLSDVDSHILARAPREQIFARIVSQLRALPQVSGAALVIEAPAGEPQAVHIDDDGDDGAALDAHLVRAQVAALAPEAPAGEWRRCVPQAHAATRTVSWCLPIGTVEGHVAWMLLVGGSGAPLDEDTLDAARPLADRVAIALALEGREGRLLHQARHDTLTGLPNRLAAIEALDLALADSTDAFAVVFMDIDRFKPVNDGLGHALGDRLLAEVGRRLRMAVAADDLVARFGGDEFVVLLRGVAAADGLAGLRAGIERAFATPVVLEGHVLPVRCSAGVAFHPTDGATAHDLVRRADMAMYAAKKDGGGRFAAYAADMDAAAREEVALVAALRGALEADALQVHYQPRIDARTGRWAGMEALVRWQDPTRGWVPPAQFVPLAEAHGLIDALGLCVLRATCTQVGAWRALGLEPGPVGVNISSAQLRTGTLVEDIARMLHDTGARWQDLEIELTESVLVADIDASARQLQALREHGVRVAIDDFGTGYSSLAYLARLPLDIIKIDRAFVVNLDEPGTASVVKAVLAMARALGKRVVTEGVETQVQLDTLRSWGCEVFQGYLFHRPMPAAAVQALLQAASTGAITAAPPPGTGRDSADAGLS